MPLMPKRDLPPADRALPLHASANIGPDNDVAIFFGLSGTGKTTLSADPKRDLIGDDEHVWTTKGVVNMEGGCYAKCVGLTRDKEPEIYNAIRFGAVLENVVYDDSTREVDFYDTSVTENTRLAYPLQFIPNARIPAVVDHHPKNVILLTCDAFGVLPPVSKLTNAQVMYHFISGYTAKVAGTVNKQGTEMVKMGGAVFQVVISDAGDEGKFTLDLKNGSAFAHFPQCEVAKADCTITMADRDFVAMAQGKLDGMAALAKGKCSIKGDQMLFQKLQCILQDPLFLWPMNLNTAK